jgi:hypothetical protein
MNLKMLTGSTAIPSVIEIYNVVGVVGQIKTPKGIHFLIPGIYGCATLHDKRGFADAIKLVILRWRG